MSRLIHYGIEFLQSVRSVKNDNRRVGGIGKPGGLWVSVEGDHDWKEWCEGEGWGLDRLAFATEIVLRPDASVLRVCGTAELDAFHAAYSFVEYVYPKGLGDRKGIDWRRVAADHQGVIIAVLWRKRHRPIRELPGLAGNKREGVI